MSAQQAAATWNAALGQLELSVTRANFDTWLRDTVGLRHEPDRFVIGAANDFAIEWLSARMQPLIAKALGRVLGHPVTVAFEVIRHDDEEPPALLPEASPDEVPDFLRKRTAAPPPALNPALTFDAFVVGDENRLAYEAAVRAAAEPGAVTPLVIFGTAGLGKTHLLNAIGHAAHTAGKSVIYAPAERFGNDYVRAIKDGPERFRARYRGCDVLLLDDVQFFEGKEKFQAEFFHAFNDLHADGAQIVVSADRAPAQLALSDALRSRLQWGLAADLQRPSFETRLAILRAKAAQHAVRLPDDALISIAEKCCPSVRELEGYLNRVIAYVPLVRGQATKEIIARALSPLQSAEPGSDAEPPAPCADDVIAAVCRRTGEQTADLRGRSRNRQVAYARHLAMYVLKEDGRKSVAEIGRAFSNRDHSTVIAGIERIRMELTTRPETADDLAAVREHLVAAAAAGAAV